MAQVQNFNYFGYFWQKSSILGYTHTRILNKKETSHAYLKDVFSKLEVIFKDQFDVRKDLNLKMQFKQKI